jgi:hypothetical protein
VKGGLSVPCCTKFSFSKRFNTYIILSELTFQDTVRLLRLALAAGEYQVSLHTLEFTADTNNITDERHKLTCLQLCKELLRFLHSIDESGETLRRTITELDIIRGKSAVPTSTALSASSSQGTSQPSALISHTHLEPDPSRSPYTGPSPHLRVDGADRAASPFQLASPRQWLTPPSPKTVVQERVGVMPDQLVVPDLDPDPELDFGSGQPDVETGRSDA